MKLSIAGILLLVSGLLSAGDIAEFQNLGFSDDSRYFAFSQYGVQEDTLFPFADLYVVDVAANRFVPQGVLRRTVEQLITPGANGSGAMHHLIREHDAILTEYGIKHTNKGRIVYARIDGEPSRDRLDFRDFETGNRFQVELIQSFSGDKADIKGRFHLDVRFVPESGSSRRFTVGLPEFDRPGVQNYRVHQAVLSPDDGSIVFVIEMQRYAEKGIDLRYMVETLRFR